MKLVATPVYDTFWEFAAERQEIFYRRLLGEQKPWTEDPILRKHKFTNVYRASDRVSQFLIREVIYSKEWSQEDLFFRILLFKLFNSIATWQHLSETLGEITWEAYSFQEYDAALQKRLQNNERVFSGAYIMPSWGKDTAFHYKHQRLLKLLECMMRDNLPRKIVATQTMHEVFTLLRSYPLIGDFLGYQFTIDLNYSPLINFSENDFVIPGPGSLRGIQKCFSNAGEYDPAEIIRFVTNHQEEEFEKRGLPFRRIGTRPLHLIDVQNLFCEVDKYSRAAHPEVLLRGKAMRIKQKFLENTNAIDYFYPPKWEIPSFS